MVYIYHRRWCVPNRSMRNIYLLQPFFGVSLFKSLYCSAWVAVVISSNEALLLACVAVIMALRNIKCRKTEE